ncbi:MAG: LON peptidase substrate-binding domain-containing protein [Caenispirillum sp.]|nr:LON peptidase substrate-binding domain-containing protein [Caenispirillum sp.]
MAILPFPQRRDPAAETQPLPLFPLNAVLFPGGTLGLRVFEQRYMTLVKDCFRQESAFGICLIAEGAEVGAPAVPHPVGTEARIVAWDMRQPGILNITVRGGERFRILSSEADRSGLLRARVEPIPAEAVLPVPQALAALVPLLQAMADDAGAGRLPPPHRFEDAAWVGCRFCELLPIPAIARQKLLELEDPVSRLEIVFKFLAQRGLVR